MPLKRKKMSPQTQRVRKTLPFSLLLLLLRLKLTETETISALYFPFRQRKRTLSGYLSSWKNHSPHFQPHFQPGSNPSLENPTRNPDPVPKLRKLTALLPRQHSARPDEASGPERAVGSGPRAWPNRLRRRLPPPPQRRRLPPPPARTRTRLRQRSRGRGKPGWVGVARPGGAATVGSRRPPSGGPGHTGPRRSAMHVGSGTSRVVSYPNTGPLVARLSRVSSTRITTGRLWR